MKTFSFIVALLAHSATMFNCYCHQKSMLRSSSKNTFFDTVKESDIASTSKPDIVSHTQLRDDKSSDVSLQKASDTFNDTTSDARTQPFIIGFHVRFTLIICWVAASHFVVLVTFVPNSKVK